MPAARVRVTARKGGSMRKSVRKPRRSRPTATCFASLVLLACLAAPSFGTDLIRLPQDGDEWALPAAASVARPASKPGVIEIRGKGTLLFDPTAVVTLRPEIFASGHFSVFDVVVHLAKQGEIELEYAFDEELQTHVIESLNGLEGWWYDAHYDGGGFDRTVVRMDQFPVMDEMSIVVYLEDPERLDAIYEHFREEVARRNASEGSIVVPTVTLRSAAQTIVLENVLVTAHDTRSDVFRSGLVTALDVLLSLGEQGLVSQLVLKWRPATDGIPADVGYCVAEVDAGSFSPEPNASCVLMHQVGGTTIADYLAPHSHTMSHIHLTPDLEILVSPETIEWIWICL
jgi:hypothetical protein